MDGVVSSEYEVERDVVMMCGINGHRGSKDCFLSSF